MASASAPPPPPPLLLFLVVEFSPCVADHPRPQPPLSTPIRPRPGALVMCGHGGARPPAGAPAWEPCGAVPPAGGVAGAPASAASAPQCSPAVSPLARVTFAAPPAAGDRLAPGCVRRGAPPGTRRRVTTGTGKRTGGGPHPAVYHCGGVTRRSLRCVGPILVYTPIIRVSTTIPSPLVPSSI